MLGFWASRSPRPKISKTELGRENGWGGEARKLQLLSLILALNLLRSVWHGSSHGRWGWVGGSEVADQMRKGKRQGGAVAGGCSMSGEREGGSKGGRGELVAWMGLREPHM